ncbi:MAG: hypothetical protein DI629_20660 [Mesorhizobium amorphae]|nr:MAG: hypothetical protein DI629_20660 [Mesorhizobium amorphae]
MPQFEMTGAHMPEFRELPPLTRGYVEAMFFTAPEPESDKEFDISEAGFSDLSEEALRRIVEDCDAFAAAHAEDIATLSGSSKVDYDEMSAGRDLWFTRNGHGVGFWDRGFEGAEGEAAERLSEAATAMGEVDLYATDDCELDLS